MEREAITAANQLRSSLLRLPGEIRNRIYEYAFCGEDNADNALLKTCRQIEHESKPIYYSHITLSFYDFGEMRHLVNKITPQLLARVRSIRTSAIPTLEMAWSVLSSVKAWSSSYIKHAGYLPGLRYWHVYGWLHLDSQQDVVKGIRQLMGPDVEVTFDTPK